MSRSLAGAPLTAYSDPPVRKRVREIVTLGVVDRDGSVRCCRSSESPRRAPGPGVSRLPAKMTSSIFPPRRFFAPCSPITQDRASTTLDLPEPLGPTTQVMPGSNLRVVAEAKNLKSPQCQAFEMHIGNQHIRAGHEIRNTFGKVSPRAQATAPFSSVAQLAEHSTVNRRVAGSSPAGGAGRGPVVRDEAPDHSPPADGRWCCTANATDDGPRRRTSGHLRPLPAGGFIAPATIMGVSRSGAFCSVRIGRQSDPVSELQPGIRHRCQRQFSAPHRCMLPRTV